MSGADPGVLLKDGIYAKIRHPRYLEIVLGMIGWSLVINYSGIYWITAVSLAALYPVILLEERELVRRFGRAYEDYMTRVPRFVPRVRTHGERFSLADVAQATQFAFRYPRRLLSGPRAH